MSNIFGTQGADQLTGGAGDDVIDAGSGNDVVDGGGGNDVIVNRGGSSRLSGGDGNDVIVLDNRLAVGGTIFQNLVTNNIIDAGTGNDTVMVDLLGNASASIDLGAGDDVLTFGQNGWFTAQNVQVTLGPGQDRVGFGYAFGDGLRNNYPGPQIRVTDFAAGNSGDILDLADLVRGFWSNPSSGANLPAVNPFASAHIRLVQDGADTVIRLDYDGTGPGQSDAYIRDVVRLVGVTATSLTAFNFNGYDPQGALPQSDSLTGSAGNDVVRAHVYGSTIDGLAGDDVLIGGNGDDHLIGGAENDDLAGGFGADWLEGGDGNDYLHDGVGNNNLSGGVGDDRIIYSGDIAWGSPVDTVTIAAGDGNDNVDFYISYTETFSQRTNARVANGTIDLGAGNDRLYLDSTAIHPVITVGAGQDRIFLGDHLVANLTITDFQAGNGGDAIELSRLVYGFQGYTDGANPFATGHIRLIQDGADTLIQTDYDGDGPGGGSSYITTVFRLVGVTATSLTAFNLDGFSPTASTIAALVINGTAGGDWIDGEAGNDSLNGLDGDDHITGGQGADTIDGGAGNDTISGGRGNDSLTGGIGDDVITDLGSGSDTLRSGDGDDVIRITHSYQSDTEHSVIDAGIGNDQIFWSSGGVLTADLGAGDDRLVLLGPPGAGSTITLGAGMDTVVLDVGVASGSITPLVFTDFATGDDGDRLDWATFIQQKAGYVGDPATFNPFATGNARLVQSGADVVLQFLAPGQTVTLATFRNTNVADFTFHNLGFDRNAAPPPSTVDTITGTPGDDHLVGTADRDVISGLAGNDTIDGLAGNDLLHGNSGDDILNGGAGEDILEGGDGSDILNGGDGNDTIVELNGGDSLAGGTDVISGGDGDDTIGVRTVFDFIAGHAVGSLDAGAGNDNVTVLGEYTPTPYSINLGTGDDHLLLRGMLGNLTITLGAGVDTIELPAYFQTDDGAVGTFTDFQAGAGGDRLELGGYIDWFLNFYNRGGTYTLASGYNPFAAGTLELRQAGANVELWLHPDAAPGAYDQVLFRFNNMTVSQLTAANLGGFAPVASQNDVHIITTNTTIAAGTTDAGDYFTTYELSRPHYVYAPQAQGVQFINNGTISTTSSIAGPALIGFKVGQYANSSATSLFQNGATGHFIVSDDWIDVSGVRNVSSYTYGYFAPTQALIFINDGDFRVSAESGLAVGVYNGHDYYNRAPTTNNGTFLVHGGYNATGFSMGTYSDFTNRGTITVTAGNDAVGIERAEGGPLHNEGLISVTGGQTAVGVLESDYANGGFVNAGTIRATTDASSPYLSIGLFIGQNSNALGVTDIVNSGTIEADFAIYVSPKYGYGTVYAASERLINSGTIIGDIDLSFGNDTIINTGHIDGFVELGQGNDQYDGRLGHLNGAVDGGTGDDMIAGGADGEILIGGLGRDSIDGGAGDDTVYGGLGADALDGGAGFDTLSYLDIGASMLIDLAAQTATVTDGAGHGGEIDLVRNFEAVVGSNLADTIRGSAGYETLDGNAGNDVIDGRAGDDVLIGGTGDDVLTGGAGNDLFAFFRGDGNDTVTDFGKNDFIAVTGYAGYSALVQEGNDLRIVLSATDSILLRGATAASITSTNLVFDASAPAPESAAIPQGATVLNETTVIPVGATFSVVDTGFGADRFFGSYDAGITLQPTYSATPVLFNGGSIVVRPTFAIPQLAGITRGDPIVAGSNYGNGDGALVNLAAGRIDVVNGNGNVWGVRGVGESWNAGTIHVQAIHGDAVGFDYISGTVHNQGNLTVEASGQATGINALYEHFFNTGTITVHGGTASRGVDVAFSVHPALPPVEFANRGTIIVTDDTAALDSIGVAYDVDGVARFWNTGTIRADYAIAWDQEFSGGGLLDDVTIYNSGTLDGRVRLSTLADRLINTGMITGRVDLDTGNDLFDGRGGQTLADVLGGAGDDTLIGGAFADRLDGGTGQDVITGGAGDDILTGGAGSDTFHVETGFGNDEITDFAAGSGGDMISVTGYAAYQSIVQQGADTLITFSATDHILLRGVQAGSVTGANFQFGAAALAPPVFPAAPTDTATPSPPDLSFIATRFLPTYGTDGDDVLGLGAIGSDSFYGGRGNDTYYVDEMASIFSLGHGDIVFENANEGTDTVISTSNFYLYANIENLTLAAGAGNIFGVGNELANSITGNEGDNTLLAGAGADLVHGGAGVDIIYGEDGNDQLFGDANNDFLAGGAGDDVIDGGTGGDSVYGEAGNDTLYGGASFEFDILVGGDGNDVLHGDSGFGDYDYLYGNAGDDSFYVDTGDDLTFEQAGEGTDTVYANVAGANNGVYLYANIENLVLLGTTTFGVGNDLANTMTGNASGNYLLGGAGNDILNGKAGNDVLFGEAGADTFVFEHGTGGDVIGDFVPGTDRIDLSAIGYTWQQVQNSLHENGGTTAIDLGNGDLVVLNGVTAAQLHQSDFILAGGSSGSAPIDATTKIDVMATDTGALLPADEGHGRLFHAWFPPDAMPLTMPMV